eukprot:gb/GECH01012032.1/.p1 GENE.gb/GECH01012032.1/~~gb/GECH01012032.1/.p1  ORF type:complete len:144 (+),score=46.40 gb/GECH01012032.1/:1-432(+)
MLLETENQISIGISSQSDIDDDIFYSQTISNRKEPKSNRRETKILKQQLLSITEENKRLKSLLENENNAYNEDENDILNRFQKDFTQSFQSELNRVPISNHFSISDLKDFTRSLMKNYQRIDEEQMKRTQILNEKLNEKLKKH